MKLYICINKASLPGYMHIDPKPKDENVAAFAGSMEDIGKLAGKSECTEILAPHILDYIPFSVIGSVLGVFSSLLRHEGKLILGGNEASELARISFMNMVDPAELNNMLYGGDFRKNGIYSIDTIRASLEKLGLVTDKIKLDSGRFTIESHRP